MNHTQADECYTCPAGYYCINTVTPEPCPAGKDHVHVALVIVQISHCFPSHMQVLSLCT